MNQNIIRENNDFSVDYKDTCVACNGPSEENKSTNVTLRKFYVEGSGQLCRKCYFNVFQENRYSNYSNLG
jgi:hypothetical protein